MTQEKVPYKQIESEGTFNGTIRDAKIIQHRFAKNGEAGFEVKLEVVTADYGLTAVYLDMRGDYINQGPHQGKKSVDVSCDTLEKLGLQGRDLSKVKSLTGKSIQIFGKKNDKGHLNFYVSNFEEKEVDPVLAAKEIAMLFSGSNTTIPMPGGAAKPNPFAQGK